MWKILIAALFCAASMAHAGEGKVTADYSYDMLSSELKYDIGSNSYEHDFKADLATLKVSAFIPLSDDWSLTGAGSKSVGSDDVAYYKNADSYEYAVGMAYHLSSSTTWGAEIYSSKVDFSEAEFKSLGLKFKVTHEFFAEDWMLGIDYGGGMFRTSSDFFLNGNDSEFESDTASVSTGMYFGPRLSENTDLRFGVRYDIAGNINKEKGKSNLGVAKNISQVTEDLSIYAGFSFRF